MSLTEIHLLRQFIRESLNKSYASLLKDDLQDIGLFITVPETIIRKIESVFQDIKKIHTHDESPNHITLLVINKDFEKLEEIKSIVKQTLSECEPFKIAISGTDAFINNNQSVLYGKVVSDDIINLHNRLKQALKKNIININHFYGNDPNDQTYKPHMTLGYYEDEKQLDNAQHLKIYCEWLVDRVELWGAGSPISIKIGKDEDEHNYEGRKS